MEGFVILIDLKDLFLEQTLDKNFSHSVDMSGVKLNGVFPFKTPLQVDVKLKKSLDSVLMDTKVSFEFCQPCDRCGCEVFNHFNYHFNHKLIPFKENDSDDDYIVLDGYTLDLDELIVSDVILEIPTKFLCKPDCKGLCFKCGKNLNEGNCSCKFDNIDPRLEALKRFL